MPDTSQQPYSLDRTRPAAALLNPNVQWSSPYDDFALGCECANPALQIERWGQEVQLLPPSQR